MFVLANPFLMFFKIIKNLLQCYRYPFKAKSNFLRWTWLCFNYYSPMMSLYVILNDLKQLMHQEVVRHDLCLLKGFTQVVFKCDNLRGDMKAMPIKHKKMMIGWKYISIQRFHKMKHPLSKKLTNCHLGFWLQCHSFFFLTPFDVIPCSPFPFKYIKIGHVGTYNINTCQYWEFHLHDWNEWKIEELVGGGRWGMGQKVKNLCEYVGGIHWEKIKVDLVVDFLHGLLMKDARWVVAMRGKEVYINKEWWWKPWSFPTL